LTKVPPRPSLGRVTSALTTSKPCATSSGITHLNEGPEGGGLRREFARVSQPRAPLDDDAGRRPPPSFRPWSTVQQDMMGGGGSLGRTSRIHRSRR
jgi:hypothetical protein